MNNFKVIAFSLLFLNSCYASNIDEVPEKRKFSEICTEDFAKEEKMNKKRKYEYKITKEEIIFNINKNIYLTNFFKDINFEKDDIEYKLDLYLENLIYKKRENIFEEKELLEINKIVEDVYNSLKNDFYLEMSDIFYILKNEKKYKLFSNIALNIHIKNLTQIKLEKSFQESKDIITKKIIKNMLTRNYDIDEISKLSGIPITDIMNVYFEILIQNNLERKQEILNKNKKESEDVTKKEVVFSMLRNGLAIDKISQMTNISLEDIKKILTL